MTSKEKLPTYAQIAKRAKVSTKTVCNVFRYPELVRSKTGERVLKALQELGVKHPDEMKLRLRATRSGKSRSILFFESGIPAGALSAPVFAKILHAAETRAHECGWQFTLRHKKSNESLAEALRNFQGEGIILFGNATTMEDLRNVLPGVSAVRLLAPPLAGADCDNVDYDRTQVCTLAALHLASKNCKSVAYFGAEDFREKHFLRIAGELGLEARSATAPEFFIQDGNSQVENARVQRRSTGFVHARRAATEHNCRGRLGSNFGSRNRVRHNLGVDPGLANAARD
jgi:DNA-binding LacI/PurR family transcriptional regulator